MVKNGGQWFEASITYPPLFQEQVDTLIGFLNGLNGMVNDFTMTIPTHLRMNSGSMTITVNADGNSFTGHSGQTGRFAVATSQGNRLVQFTGTGSLFPALPAGNHTLSNSAGAKFRLTSNDVSFETSETRLWGTSITVRDSI